VCTRTVSVVKKCTKQGLLQKITGELVEFAGHCSVQKQLKIF